MVGSNAFMLFILLPNIPGSSVSTFYFAAHIVGGMILTIYFAAQEMVTQMISFYFRDFWGGGQSGVA